MAKVLIHGGGSNWKDVQIVKVKQAETDQSCADVKLAGMSAVDIVEAATALQELKPSLNAGIGSVIQLDGVIRTDAAICDSSGRYAGIMQLEQVANPVKVARRLMERGYHSILSGVGARLFALEEGFPSVSLHTDHAIADFREERRAFPDLSYKALTRDIVEVNRLKMSTVGAVAIDDNGNMAAANSTGGTGYCFPGRVGDTPVFGAGLYCSEHVAVALTGEGDKVLRRLTAKRVEELYLKYNSLQRAADEAIQDLLQKEKGYGGIIAVARTGETAKAHSTSTMIFAAKES
jgi:isoaspartyl peptidase/L-asparaginase-like protein (Ntn-hydrolase superfamily)